MAQRQADGCGATKLSKSERPSTVMIHMYSKFSRGQNKAVEGLRGRRVAPLTSPSHHAAAVAYPAWLSAASLTTKLATRVYHLSLSRTQRSRNMWNSWRSSCQTV